MAEQTCKEHPNSMFQLHRVRKLPCEDAAYRTDSQKLVAYLRLRPMTFITGEAASKHVSAQEEINRTIRAWKKSYVLALAQL